MFFDQDEVALLHNRIHDLEREVERLQRQLDPTYTVSFLDRSAHPHLRLVWSQS